MGPKPQTCALSFPSAWEKRESMIEMEAKWKKLSDIGIQITHFRRSQIASCRIPVVGLHPNIQYLLPHKLLDCHIEYY